MIEIYVKECADCGTKVKGFDVKRLNHHFNSHVWRFHNSLKGTYKKYNGRKSRCFKRLGITPLEKDSRIGRFI